MKHTTSWIVQKPLGGVVIPFDRCILAPYKIFYLAVRITLGLIMGKDKRNKSYLFNKLFPSGETSPSFQMCIYFNHILKFFKNKTNDSIQIYIPKYDYKVTCSLKTEDFLNHTIREADILEHYSVQDGDFVIDVGAHVGRYAMISSKKTGPNGKVVAIEADPSVFELLNQNIKINNMSNVITLNYAVHSSEGLLKLFIPTREPAHTLYNTTIVNRAPTRDLGNFINVNANTLDNIVMKLGINTDSVKWIKIDVEGAELEVLKGSSRILEKSKDLSVLVEIHNIAENKNLYHPIMELLEGFGFDVVFKKVHESGEMHVIFKKKIQEKTLTIRKY